jgi:N-acetylmuramic acid 6-phosphate etherase
MRVANAKLRDRATRICIAAADCTEEAARIALHSADDDISVAVVMLARGLDAPAARALLEGQGGALRSALEQSG